MSIVSIPAYAYFGSTTKQISLDYFCDDYLIDHFRTLYYQGSEPAVQVWHGEDLHENNLSLYVNRVLGVMCMPRNYSFYAQLREGASEPTTEITKLYGLSGLNLVTLRTPGVDVSHIYTLNNFDVQNYNGSYFIGSIANGASNFIQSRINGVGGFGYVTCGETNDYNIIAVSYSIYPEGVFTKTGINTDYPVNKQPVQLNITAYTDTNSNEIKVVDISVSFYNHLEILKGCYTYNGVEFTTTNAGVVEHDATNPYGWNGNSGTGGGDGTFNTDSDANTEVPELPDIDAADLGFITIYNPTKAELKALSAFMWSPLFTLDTYKKIFSDPMDSIIGLAIVPVQPNIGGTKNVMFGTIDSNVSMSYCSSQFVNIDCGSVEVNKYVGAFLDYDYTKISIYLPYIGFRELDPDDIMGRTVSVEYNVDVLSGACAAFISTNDKGVLYSYNGSCITNIPLTSSNFSGAIQNAVSAVISGAGMLAGAATGAAPLTAMGATGLLSSAANVALNSKPSIGRSGNMGGSAGILSVQHPFLIIERPDVSVPSNIQSFVGQTSNITMNLGECSGFTMVESVHLNGLSATAEEIKEIENLLKGGVIL